ncbi:MAG: hypothetical protein ACRDJV_10225 [Actinomycetota bacterium]
MSASKAPASRSLAFASHESRRRWPTSVGVIPWAALVAGVAAWGAALARARPEIHLDAAPLFGRVDPHPSWRIAPALVLGALAVAYAQRIAGRVSWRRLLLMTTIAAAGWALALAFVDGQAAWYEPLLGRHEYLQQVARIDSLSLFLGGFVEDLASFPIHVQGHPPGMVAVLYGLDGIGFGGAQWAAALVIGAGASAAAAVLIALRAVAGENIARTAAPFVVLAPAAIWIATSADAFFTGVSAWAVALGVVAVVGAGRRATVAAVCGGMVFGCALLLSYGVVLLGFIVVAVAWSRRRAGPALLFATSASVVLVGAGMWGFWWPDGLLATRAAYLAGVASDRPHIFFFVSNLAAFALVLGPATAAALLDGRVRGAGMVVAPALAAVTVAAISGMSKGEVERIWLPFAVWILPAAVWLRATLRRRWLAAQVAVALVIQVLVVTPW